MTPLKVSVIVPIYNAERYFERCLHSLFRQTLKQIEYIFVNDCTPDGSMAVLDKVLESYPECREQVRIVEHTSNKGVGAARSTGMHAASGDFVIHCDSDDWVEPDMYEKMYNAAMRELADIVCCGFFVEYRNVTSVENYTYDQETTESMIRGLIRGSFKQSLWNKLVRRELYIRHNCMPFEGVNMGEDLGLSVRLVFLSQKTIVLRSPFYHYNRQNENSIMTVEKPSNIEERILCARNIDDFFKNQPGTVYEDFQVAINRIKFTAKVRLFTCRQTRDIARWKSLFPESHRYLWRYTAMPFTRRMVFWLALHGFAGLIARRIDDYKQQFARRQAV